MTSQTKAQPMDCEMIEEIARALARADCDPLLMSEIAIALYVDKRWTEKIPAARAAYSVMAGRIEGLDKRPEWVLVHAVRGGALNALRHAGVSEDLFATVAAATYAPIRSTLSPSTEEAGDE